MVDLEGFSRIRVKLGRDHYWEIEISGNTVEEFLKKLNSMEKAKVEKAKDCSQWKIEVSGDIWEGIAEKVSLIEEEILSKLFPIKYLLKKVHIEEHSFPYWRVIGNIGKELVRTLLEACEYSVYPFGYESYLTHVKDLIHTRKIRKIPQLQRMPDLLVLDEEKGDLEMVEVITKTTKPPNDADIEKQKLNELKKFWPDSILAVVLPKGEYVFYAEKITELKITNHEFVNFDISESPINKVFPRVDDHLKVLKELQGLCKKIFSNV